MATDTEVAWAAGFFEGEGSISLYRETVALVAESTDPDVLHRFWRIVESGNCLPQKRQMAHHKQSYRWTTGVRDDCEAILRMFLPWFGERRSSRAMEALVLIAQARCAKPMTCERCGNDFEQRPGRARPRKYCYACSRPRFHAA